VLSKSQPLHDILATVQRLQHGEPVLGTAERDALIEEWRRHESRHGEVRERINQLTAREREVLGHLMRGHPVREIAAHGVVSEATVRTQVKSILSKLEVSSQLAAVGLAHSVGWQVPLG
jgi:DNA-binding NarL/FixJ family response regulator